MTGCIANGGEDKLLLWWRSWRTRGWMEVGRALDSPFLACLARRPMSCSALLHISTAQDIDGNRQRIASVVRPKCDMNVQHSRETQPGQKRGAT